MAKVNQVSNGDTGLIARTNFNDAMKTVETNASIVGDGTIANPLAVLSTAIQHNFSFGDASPALVFTSLANKRIFSADVILENAFNGIGATLSIGDTSNNQSVFEQSAISLVEIATYAQNLNTKFNINTPVNLYINPGTGATQGSGIILLHTEK